MLQAARQQGILSHFETAGEPGDALLQFWAAFPFRAEEVHPDGSFKLNSSELKAGLQALPGEGTDP